MPERSGRSAEEEAAGGGEEPRRSPAKEDMEGVRGRSGGAGGQSEEEEKEKEKESMMMELTRLVQKAVKESGWWERRGIDCSILAAAFLCLPPGESAREHGGVHVKIDSEWGWTIRNPLSSACP